MTPRDEFMHEPDADDVLQVAGDAGLDAIHNTLERLGVDGEDYSVVITLERGDDIATCLHLPGEPDESEHARIAFETQVLHLGATARAIGVAIQLVPMPRGQG